MQLVTHGCDTFDSCYPTRVGRHGTMLTDDGPLRVVSRALSRPAGAPSGLRCRLACAAVVLENACCAI
jgi:queuine tRNA-ribosyltransferase